MTRTWPPRLCFSAGVAARPNAAGRRGRGTWSGNTGSMGMLRGLLLLENAGYPFDELDDPL
jgi:hypothetical protein